MRKTRYGETIGAKMKAAREALPALKAKHSVRSDMSIFNMAGGAPEVHALLDKARPEKVMRGCLMGASGIRALDLVLSP